MIYQVIEYWCTELPTKEDIINGIEAAKKHQCKVRLNWKGLGYQWYGDTYSRILTSDSNADEVFEGLPKVYGV